MSTKTQFQKDNETLFYCDSCKRITWHYIKDEKLINCPKAEQDWACNWCNTERKPLPNYKLAIPKAS